MAAGSFEYIADPCIMWVRCTPAGTPVGPIDAGSARLPVDGVNMRGGNSAAGSRSSDAPIGVGVDTMGEGENSIGRDVNCGAGFGIIDLVIIAAGNGAGSVAFCAVAGGMVRTAGGNVRVVEAGTCSTVLGCTVTGATGTVIGAGADSTGGDVSITVGMIGFATTTDCVCRGAAGIDEVYFGGMSTGVATTGACGLVIARQAFARPESEQPAFAPQELVLPPLERAVVKAVVGPKPW